MHIGSGAVLFILTCVKEELFKQPTTAGVEISLFVFVIVSTYFIAVARVAVDPASQHSTWKHSLKLLAGHETVKTVVS